MDFQSGINQDRGRRTNKYRLLIEVKFTTEIVTLRFASELAQLGKVLVNHYNLSINLISGSIVYKYFSILISRIKLIFKPESSSRSLANLTTIIKDYSLMTSNSGFVNQWQTSFLDNSSSTTSIPHKLNYKETNTSSQFREIEFFIEDVIRWELIVKLSYNSTFKTVKVDTSVEWFHSLAVVG